MLKRYIYSLQDSGGTGTPTFFGTPTGTGGDASSYHETTVIQGAAGSIVTIQVTSYVNSNPSGQVFVNGTQVFLNNSFTVTLDGSGNGSFASLITGNAGAGGTAVLATFTITGITAGQIGSPVSHQISKSY